MTFEPDTSGVVPWTAGNGDPIPVGGHRWEDLSPFVQGYVEALFESERPARRGLLADTTPADLRALGFSDLAPEALALILRDCASFENFATGLGMKKLGAAEGGRFWHGRNDGSLGPTFAAAFPPLTPYLAEDGKIHFREAGQ